MTASEAEPARKDEATALYLDLLKGCLTRDLFPEQEVIDITWWREGDFYDTPEAVWEEVGDREQAAWVFYGHHFQLQDVSCPDTQLR